MLRAPDIFKFEARESIGGTEFGVIFVPAACQHRSSDPRRPAPGSAGIHLAIQGIATDLEKARSGLAAAKRTGAEPAVLAQFQEKIDLLNAQRERFGRERTTLQIFIEDDQVAFKQMFFDIADNALGITSSVRARFDSRKVVNLEHGEEVMVKHALLKGRVDPEQDRIGHGNDPNLMGAKHVAEIIRTLAVGIEGRIGRRLEDELREDALVQQTNEFLDALVAAFPPLDAVIDGRKTPEDLRKTSLLGSTVMFRVLAGTYAELVEEYGFDEDDVTEFFRKLAPHMDGPVTEDSIWVTEVPADIFTPGALAPRSRRQDLKSLRDTLVTWARQVTAPSFLTAERKVA